MFTRLGIALSAIFLINTGSIVVPAQARPLLLAAGPVWTPSRAGHNRQASDLTHAQSQVPLPPPKPLHKAPAVWVEPKIQREKIVHKVMPVWPPVFMGRMQGTVRLRAFIDKQDNVQELQYLAGPPLLVQPTMEAVRQWKYKPTFRDGRPVDVETTIDVAWHLGEQEDVRVQFPFAPAKVAHRVLPKYPPEAKAKGIEGQVLLRAVIRKDGPVEILRKISGRPILAKAAIEAMRQWVYQPALRNGEPTEVRTRITVFFTLAKDEKNKAGRR